MSNLPKYYFQDIPAAVMEEIIQGMERALPEPSWEEIDHWLNCHNAPATIPAWYERVEEFASVANKEESGEKTPLSFLFARNAKTRIN
jgi:hypothetical protein